ncbi:MAG TPA: hypothetical protein VGC97_16180 [Pyrinomonadaceae bacterium]|jgi:hypothetical protein
MRKIFSIALIFLALLAAGFVFARISSPKNNFQQAEDFPRGCLIYLQVRNLSALIKLWNDSAIRQKYLESRNFADFQSNHLALKLIERANEINEAAGIFPDLSFASGLSETSAALAVYDVGKMEFVVVAPLSEEKILASKLFEMRPNFEEIRLDDETVIYSKEIDVDRARQRQKILFTSYRGRFILATSEKYFLQTLDNIKGRTPKNRLSGEPLFAALAAKTKPKLATVWLNQQALNDDWYFKHYWLMSELETLKNLRAAMFDFELQDKKAIEKRVFLTKQNQVSAKIDPRIANRLSALIPENIPFYKIQPAEQENFEDSVSDILFDVSTNSETDNRAPVKPNYHFRDWEKSYSYTYLDDDFSEEINDGEDSDLPINTAVKAKYDLAKIIGAARPAVSVKLFSPENLRAPLFFENRKALIFSLQNPGGLNRRALEASLSESAQFSFTVNNRKAEFAWTDFPVGDSAARQLAMPSLGWKIFYAVRQNELIFTGSEDLLKDILASDSAAPKFQEGFEKFTVLNPGSGRAAFDRIFETLEPDRLESEGSYESGFFTKNIGSLLDVLSDIERIEIKQNSAQNLLFEEIDFVLKQKQE